MNRYRQGMVGVLGILVVSGSGCAPTPGIEVDIPMLRPFSDFPTLGVEVVPTAEGAMEVRSRLATLAVVGFRRMDTFEHVVDTSSVEPGPIDLRMEIDIVELHRLNIVQQTLLGVFGREWLKVDVRCRDEREGKVLCEFEVTGASAAGNVFSKGIEQALQATVDLIMVYIRRHR